MRKKQKIKSDPDFEIRFYEGILRRKSDFVQVLIALGDLYTKKGWVDKGLQVDLKLSRLRPDDPIIHYNLACSYSLINQIDKAYRAMKEAIRHGYDDFPYLEQDTDLENLRKDSRFKGYYSRLKKKQEKVSKKKNS